MSPSFSPAGATLLSLLTIATSAAAQRPISLDAPVRDTVIDAARRTRVIDTLIERLEGSYVFPEKVPAIAAALRARAARGGYDSISSAVAFAEALTASLQELVADRHLRVRYTDAVLPRTRPQPGPPTPAQAQRGRDRAREESYGLGRSEVMAGNIGYLEVRSFGFPAEFIAEGVAAAMTPLADTDALIIDIRANGGGTPYAVAHLASYLFGPDSVHLNSIYWRPEDSTMHFWTSRDVPGRRFGPTKPVYVLVGGRTFSAAEEFAYDLQTRKRATIVGAATRGGANPGQGERLDDHFFAFVPSGRAINPVTGGNWEGVGVIPDVPVDADSALSAALDLARRQGAAARPR